MLRLDQQSATAGHWTEDQYRWAFRTESPTRFLLVVESSNVNPAVEGQGILGFLIASHIPPEWELENLVVAPTARRKGLAKRLLEALLHAAGETNSPVFLEVRESNAAARALYESEGFKQAGRRPSYYKSPPEDAILYRWTVA